MSFVLLNVLLFMLRVLRVLNDERPGFFFTNYHYRKQYQAIFLGWPSSLLYKKKNDPMCFHICSELYFYFTGRDAGNADQKQTFLKEPIQVKGKGILHVL